MLEPTTAIDASKGSTTKSITITPRVHTFTALDQELQLTASVIGANGKPVSNPNVTWTSLNTSVATVSKTGRVTSVGVGTAQITESSQGVTDLITVTVQQTIVAVTVTPGATSLEIGGSEKLAAVAWDASDNVVATSFTWTSTAEDVATVDQAGLVTAKGEGEATITAAAAQGSVSATSTITVYKKKDPPSDPPPSEWNRVLADTTVIGDVVVPDGEAWLIGPNVKVQGNVRMGNGTIALLPGSSLKILGADPSRYVGGGMHFTPGLHDNDFGIWVGASHGGTGKLDISCTPKTSWNRTGVDPTWKADDEYWIAATGVGEYLPKRWYPSQAVPQIDPRVPAAEVANMTRDCSITGPGHIHIHSSVPQRIEDVRLDSLGVIVPGAETTISGRYALHLHMGGEGLRGTVVRDVAATNSLNRVFVPHASHGVTLNDNVSLNGRMAGLWWDEAGAEHRTRDLAVDRLLVMGQNLPREGT